MTLRSLSLYEMPAWYSKLVSQSSLLETRSHQSTEVGSRRRYKESAVLAGHAI